MARRGAGPTKAEGERQRAEYAQRYERFEEEIKSHPENAVDDGQGLDAIRAAATLDEGAPQEDFYKQYTPSKLRDGIGPHHPDPVVETRTLAQTDPPNVWYKPRLKDACKKGTLSSLQIETIVYANQRFHEFFDDGSRCGFFLGDGAGTGKGRQIAGLVYNHLRQGGKRAAWISASPDLLIDAQRDLNELDLEPELTIATMPPGARNVKKMEKQASDGIVYGTYATLARSFNGTGVGPNGVECLPEGSRLKQLVDFLAKDENGPLIVLDECHRAKNAYEKTNEDTGEDVGIDDDDDIGAGEEENEDAGDKINGIKRGRSKTAEVIIALQKALPRARVLYCSATGASEPRNLAYMIRLGSHQFESVQKMIDSLKTWGLGAMEAFAMGLKAKGAYLSRALSYDGAEFHLRPVNPSTSFLRMYDRAAELWQLIIAVCETYYNRNIVRCSRRSDGKITTKNLRGHLYAAHQRFFRQMLLAAKVLAVAKEAIKGVHEDGYSVIIGLQNTGEANINQAHKEGHHGDFVSAPKQVLRNFINNNVPSRAHDVPGVVGLSADLRKLYYQVKAIVDGWRRSEPLSEGANGHDDEDELAFNGEKSFDEVEFEKREEAKRTGAMIDLTAKMTGEQQEEIDRQYEEGKREAEALAQKRGADERNRALQQRRNAARLISRNDPELASKVETLEDDPMQGLAKPRGLLVGRRIHMDPMGDGRPAKEGKVVKFDADEESYLASFAESDAPPRWLGHSDIVDSLVPLLPDGTPCVSCGRAEGEMAQCDVCDAPYHFGCLDNPPPLEQAEWACSKCASAPSEPQAAREENDKMLFKSEEPPKKKVKTAEHDHGNEYSDGADGSGAHKDSLNAEFEAVDRWLNAIHGLLLEGIECLELPPNPLDHLVDLLGGEQMVAEMTGREFAFVRESGTMQLRRRKDLEGTTGQDVNLRERESFMNGHKLVAIISEAASAGISLHADKRFPNCRRRLHIAMELPWSADKAIQQFGRSHRSFQQSAPVYKIMMTPIGGERRFASSAASRLQSLGALLRADRNAIGPGNELKSFNVDSKYGADALEVMYTTLSSFHKEMLPGVHIPALNGVGQSRADFTAYAADCLSLVGLVDKTPGGERMQHPGNSKKRKVGLFLNRLLGLRVSDQNALFNFFTEHVNAIVESKKSEGTYDGGITVLNERSICVMGEEELCSDGNTGAQAKLVCLRIDCGMSFDEAKAELDRVRAEGLADSYTGFWVDRHDSHCGSGVPRITLITPIRRTSWRLPQYRQRFPNHAKWFKALKREDLATMDMVEEDEEAEYIWNRIFRHFLDKCRHSKTNCCKRLMRIDRKYLATGAILPVWKAVSEFRHADVHKEPPRVVSVETDEGRRVVGLEIKEDVVEKLKAEIKGGRW